MTNDIIPQKQCSMCKEYFPQTGEYFHKNKAAKDGLCHICKPCNIAKTKKHYWDDPEKARQQKREYGATHKEEISAAHKIYYINNAETIKQRVRDWVADNPERKREMDRLYYEANKEHIMQVNKEWADAHPDIVAQAKRDYFLRNPERRRQSANDYGKSEKGRLSRIRRRARVQSLPDTLTGEQWADCLDYWNYSCAVCGKSHVIHADHYIPLASPDCTGTIATNIIPLCKSCNSSKCDTPPDEWILRKVGINGKILLERIREYFDLVSRGW